MEQEIRIDQFLDEDGRLTQLPRRRNARVAALKYLASKFKPDRDYTEKQVNEIIEQWHTFSDFFILRRELVDWKLLGRERNGSRYWLEKQDDDETVV